MRTTVTFDDDVFASLQETARRTGQSFRSVLNQTLRHGLQARARPQVPQDVEIPVFDPGLRAGLSYADIETLLEMGEGPLHK